MSTTNGHKIKVDAADLSLREHAAAVEASAPWADSLSAADYVVAGMVWQIQLRTDPNATFEQALDLKFSEIDLVGTEETPDPEVPGGDSGIPPRSSRARGESVQAK